MSTHQDGRSESEWSHQSRQDFYPFDNSQGDRVGRIYRNG